MSCAGVLALAGAVALQMGGDTVALAPHPEGGLALCYRNVAPPASTPGPFTLLSEGVAVSGRVRTGGAGRERIEVLPPPGWMVWPAEDAVREVPDGGSVTVRIVGGVS